MAIVRTAGTEVLRTQHFEYVASNQNDLVLIHGVQHHIYTVLSIIVHYHTQNDPLLCWLKAANCTGEGTFSAQQIRIFKTQPTSGNMPVDETFVWNDKFSFNGTEGTAFTGNIDSAADQNLIADQATTNAQQLIVAKTHDNAQYHITVSFLDQNNS